MIVIEHNVASDSIWSRAMLCLQISPFSYIALKVNIYVLFMQTWKWLLAALTLFGGNISFTVSKILFVLIFYFYLLIGDLSFRLLRRKPSEIISHQIHDKSNIIELKLRTEESNKPFNSMKKCSPGQYVYIKCPAISFVQWHPFSLTSVSS